MLAAPSSQLTDTNCSRGGAATWMFQLSLQLIEVVEMISADTTQSRRTVQLMWRM